VAVEGTPQSLRGGGTATSLFAPAFEVVDAPALMETEQINFVHGRARGLDSNHLHAILQCALKLKMVVHQPEY
jgi:hypothetical protein